MRRAWRPPLRRLGRLRQLPRLRRWRPSSGSCLPAFSCRSAGFQAVRVASRSGLRGWWKLRCSCRSIRPPRPQLLHQLRLKRAQRQARAAATAAALCLSLLALAFWRLQVRMLQAGLCLCCCFMPYAIAAYL